MQVSRRKRQKHDLVCENYFFPFLFLCQSHFQVEVPFFFFFFFSMSVSDCFTLIILENFRSQGGVGAPPRPLLAPPVGVGVVQLQFFNFFEKQLQFERTLLTFSKRPRGHKELS